MDDGRKRDVARKVEIGTSVAAGSVGSALGASKLRDAYAEEHKASFARGEARLTRVNPRLGRFVAHAKPGFKPLVAGTATAITATAASKYRQSHDRKVARAGVAKDYRQEPDRALDRIDQVDARARKLKVKVLPPRPVIARKIAEGTGRIRADVQRDLNKAYDPKRTRRRRARTVQAVALTGAAGAGTAAGFDRRAAHRSWEASRASEVSAGRSFTAAREAGGVVATRLAAHAENARRGTPHGLSRGHVNMGNTFAHHQREYHNLDRGMATFVRAYREGTSGHELLRVSNRKALAAAGLTAVGLKARSIARRNKG